jgi:hypothetical protein
VIWWRRWTWKTRADFGVDGGRDHIGLIVHFPK